MILKCFDLEQYQINAKIFKNKYIFFKVVKANTKKEKLKKPKTEKSFLLTPENRGDRVLSVFKTKRCFKN